MPSVAMPLMDRTMSPTAMPPLAAFPPSVSCKHKKTQTAEITNSITGSKKAPVGGRVKVKYKFTLYLSQFIAPFSLEKPSHEANYRPGPAAHDGGSAVWR